MEFGHNSKRLRSRDEKDLQQQTIIRSFISVMAKKYHAFSLPSKANLSLENVEQWPRDIAWIPVSKFNR